MKLTDLICPNCGAISKDVLLNKGEASLCQLCHKVMVTYIGNYTLGSGQDYRVMAARKGLKKIAKRKSVNHKDNRGKKNDTEQV